MHTELVTIPTDTTPLDGAYYTPDERPSCGAVIFFHGNTMNFYVGAPRFLPPSLTALGFTCLAFNRRGHDILSMRNDKETIEGGAFQTSAQAQTDHEIAADWLTQQGFPTPVVIAHSNGGMMSPPFLAAHPDTPALVLLSAGRGGPAREQRTGLLGGSHMHEFRSRAQQLVDVGRGRDLMLVPGWWYAITAESFLDRLETVPDLLDAASSITCPTLYIRGDQESATSFPGEEYARRSGGRCEFELIEDCDHFYNGKQDVVSDLVCAFLTKHLPATSPRRACQGGA